MGKEIKKEFEELAVMINAGFNSMQEQMDKRFERVDEQFVEMRGEIKEIRNDLQETKQELSQVKDIMMRREDYYIEEVGDIKRRVDRIEDHVGIPHGASA